METSPPRPEVGVGFYLESMKKLILLSVIVFFICLARGNAETPGVISRLLADKALAGASVGISVYDVSADSAIFGYQADKFFTPASNLKLFTNKFSKFR